MRISPLPLARATIFTQYISRMMWYLPTRSNLLYITYFFESLIIELINSEVVKVHKRSASSQARPTTVSTATPTLPRTTLRSYEDVMLFVKRKQKRISNILLYSLVIRDTNCVKSVRITIEVNCHG